VATETVKQQIEQQISDYRHVTVDEIAIECNMSHAFLHYIVHGDLGYRKVCSRWDPWQLSHSHKHAWHTICQQHLDHHVREGDAFLHQIVTEDESWVYHYEQESKRQSMQWKHPVISGQQKIQYTAFHWESHVDIFWDVNGPILVHFQEKGQTLISARYSDILVNELKPMI
jgi:histone-lysine N-methyltransferase SETMAR